MSQTLSFITSKTKGPILTTDMSIFLGSLALLVIKCIFQCITNETMKHNKNDVTFYKLASMFSMVIKEDPIIFIERSNFNTTTFWILTCAISH